MLRNAVSAVTDVDREFPAQVREGFQIFFCDLSCDRLLIAGVYQCHTASLEAGATEPSSVYAVGVCHDVVELLEPVSQL